MDPVDYFRNNGSTVGLHPARRDVLAGLQRGLREMVHESIDPTHTNQGLPFFLE